MVEQPKPAMCVAPKGEAIKISAYVVPRWRGLFQAFAVFAVAFTSETKITDRLLSVVK